MLALAYMRGKSSGRKPFLRVVSPAGRQRNVEAGPEPRGKLPPGIWSRLQAHLLLNGPAGAPYELQFIEDDYWRLARRAHEQKSLGLR
jgi:hypothetical protein